MIDGAHAILYSADAEADRAFLRDVLGFSGVDAGGGWMIFALPPAEVAVHPAERSGGHELYLMCDDVEELVRSMRARGVACSQVHEERWGRLIHVTLPGGGQLGIYEPKHPRAPAARRRRSPSRGPARAGTRSRRKRTAR